MKVTTSPAGPTPKEALEYFREKKLEPDLDLDEAWKEEHALAFRVAGVAAEDLLGAMRSAIDRALAEGRTFEQFAAGLDDVTRALGWTEEGDKPPHRLRLIFDANMRVARAAGQWARIQRTKDLRPFLEYRLGPSERHRPVHESWAGTVLPVDDPWWSTHATPNGFNCKCHIRQLSRAEAERRGIADEPPAGDPDPGWSGNPGATRGA